MRTLKTFTLLFICISLLAGNVASASMLCCKTSDSTIQKQKDSQMDCHKSQDSKKSGHAKQCNDCKSCINANVINTSQSYQTIAVSAIKHLIPNNLFVSINPNGIDNPPKLIS